MKIEIFEKDDLSSRVKNSCVLKDGCFYVYLADRRILNEEGQLIGFYDTYKSLNPRYVVCLEEEGHLSVTDFEDLDDFKTSMQIVKSYLESKQGDKDA